VDHVVDRREMVGPSLGAGGHGVVPGKLWNSNGIALAVVDLQDSVDEISIVTTRL
jgi:hypothetical protein